MIQSDFFYELVLRHRPRVVVHMEPFCSEGFDSLLANVFKNQHSYIFIVDGMEHPRLVTILFVTPYIPEVIMDARQASWRVRRRTAMGLNVDRAGHGEGKR